MPQPIAPAAPSRRTRRSTKGETAASRRAAAQAVQGETAAAGRAAAQAVHGGAAAAGGTATQAGHTVVAVVGLGYVGLPTAIALRNAGCRIVGIDVSGPRLSAIRDGEAELLESEQRDLRRHLEGDGFVLTNRVDALDAADLVLICVPTPVDEQLRPGPADPARGLRRGRAPRPPRPDARADLDDVRRHHPRAARRAAGRAWPDASARTCSWRSPPSASTPASASTSSYRRRASSAASPTCCRERAAAVLRHTCERLHHVSSPEAAEMVKLYENTFRAVNIALAFEIAEACSDARPRPDRGDRGRRHASPTASWPTTPPPASAATASALTPTTCCTPCASAGGPRRSPRRRCARSPAARATSPGARTKRWSRSAARCREARVLVVGASYKPGVADTREAPALEIIARLRAEGAHVDYHDPLVPTLAARRAALSGVCPDPGSTPATPAGGAPRSRARRLRPGDPRDAAPRPRLRLAGALPGGARLHLPHTPPGASASCREPDRRASAL